MMKTIKITVAVVLIAIISTEQTLAHSWWDRILGRAQSGWNTVRDHARQAVEDAHETSHTLAGLARQAASDVGDTVRSGVNSGADFARQAAQDVRDTARSGLGLARRLAQQARDAVTD